MIKHTTPQRTDVRKGPEVLGRHYALRCPECGGFFEDDGLALESPCCQSAGLLRAIYAGSSLSVGPPEDGLFRFRDWLPVRRQLPGSAAPVTYRSTALAERLGLGNLWITFTGYWPEREAWTQTGTFKENEAYAVCARLPEKNDRVLVVASAGNTARAFAHVCSRHDVPLLLVIPEFALEQLWFYEELSPCVKAVAVQGDYTDAIQLAGAVSRIPGFLSEGGARNVARRDGMGTTFLSAVTESGTIPDHYFQAIGSGTGAIAAWEAGIRLREDGAWGDRTTRLHVAQNSPFVPIIKSWEMQSRTLLLGSGQEARGQIEEIGAKVLANRTPAYSMAGGLFEAMTRSGGEGYAVSNREASVASEWFGNLEGIDPSPAAAVAVAALMQAVEKGSVHKDDVISLNITGGGIRHRKLEAPYRLRPARTVGVGELQDEDALLELKKLFA